MKKYKEGESLAEDEYLLKIRKDGRRSDDHVGFMTKLNKTGKIPVAFDSWNSGKYGDSERLPIYVVKETFKKGWKLLSWRFGMSQNWAVMLHPDNYTVEIYLNQFLEIIESNTVINGEIQGKFKWENNELIKEN